MTWNTTLLVHIILLHQFDCLQRLQIVELLREMHDNPTNSIYWESKSGKNPRGDLSCGAVTCPVFNQQEITIF